MSVLDSLIKLRAFEDQQEQRDVQAIGQSVNNFINIRNQKVQQERQSVMDEFNKANILSQIESRKSGGIDDLIKGANLRSQGLDLGDENLFNIGQAQINKVLSGGKTAINQFLDPVASKSMPITTVDDELISPEKALDASVIESSDNTFEGLLKQRQDKKIAEKQQESDLAVKQQVSSQSAKASELASRDFLRASGAVDTAFDAAINFGKVHLDKFGLRPGQLFGVFDKLIPSEQNKFKDAFAGAGREAASLIARQLIPGVRAASITRIFAKSAPEIGKTIEANAENAAASMGNALVNSLSANIDVIDEETGETVKIQDSMIDPNTGNPLSQLGFEDKIKAMNDIKRNFAENMAQDYVMRAFKVDPDLLQPKTRNEILNSLTEEQIAEMLSEE